MLLSGEQIFVTFLKTVLLIGTGYFLIALGSLVLKMDCASTVYPGAFQWSWLLSLFAVAVYSKFDVLSKGLFKARVAHVRVATACLLSTELVIAVYLGTQLELCESVDGGMIAPPAAYLMIYTVIAVTLLFGDGWLGWIRNLIRLGQRPFDLSPGDDEEPAEAKRSGSRRKGGSRS